MAFFIIEGGEPLVGTVEAQGSKNAALPILAASLLADSPVAITGVPRLRDVTVMTEILRALGTRVDISDGGRITIYPDLRTSRVPSHLTRLMRSSIFFMGPLLARTGRVRISYPGGCIIGHRPIDLHLKGLRELGARIEEEAGYITARADGLRGATIHLDAPSVGATENLMMAAVLAEGRTIISHAAREPEIVDLQTFLTRLGARVRGAGTNTIVIDGVDSLAGGVVHRVIPDRIETATLMMAAAITGGDITVERVIPEHVEPVSAKLTEAGLMVTRGHDSVRVKGRTEDGPLELKAADIKTLPYPGFPTDAQNQFLALATVARGVSVITENIFEQRFRVAEELRRMGADITIDGRTAVVRGVSRLTGAEVQAADDLRGVAALVLAGLNAKGTTVVSNAQFIERGYDGWEEKLRGLGANITKVSAEQADESGPRAPMPGRSVLQ